MLSLGKQSKFVGNLSKTLYQVPIGSGGINFRSYADSAEDEDIKWQWSVRDSPCQVCYKYKSKRGWIAKLLGRKSEELTNKHSIVEYKPKIWELQYYDYLFPQCDAVTKSKYISHTHGSQSVKGRKGRFMVCGQDGEACFGKRRLNLEPGDEQKTCTQKFQFEHKEPFCLNQVCGKTKPPEKDKNEEKEFLCFNYLIDKNKSSNETNSKGKHECD